jgi:hypothetical protein
MGEELDKARPGEPEGVEGEIDRSIKATEEPEVEAHMKIRGEPTEKSTR